MLRWSICNRVGRWLATGAQGSYDVGPNLSYDFKVARGAFGKLLQTELQRLLRGGLHFGELDAVAQGWIQGSYDPLALASPSGSAMRTSTLVPSGNQFHVTPPQADVCCFPGSGIGLFRAM